MARVLTAKDICSQALRSIGSFPITDSAPDGEQLRQAMVWLDLIMGELAGTEELFFFVPETVAFPIVNGTRSYNLFQGLGADIPADKIQMVSQAFLDDGVGNRVPLTIVQRETYENVSRPDQVGTPKWVYIDRLPVPTLSIWPTPGVSDPTAYSIALIVQRFSPNVSPGGITGAQASGSILTGFSQAWQRYLIWQLAHDLGSGPVVKISESSLNRFGKLAGEAMSKLLTKESREHDNEPPVLASWDQ